VGGAGSGGPRRSRSGRGRSRRSGLRAAPACRTNAPSPTAACPACAACTLNGLAENRWCRMGAILPRSAQPRRHASARSSAAAPARYNPDQGERRAHAGAERDPGRVDRAAGDSMRDERRPYPAEPRREPRLEPVESGPNIRARHRGRRRRRRVRRGRRARSRPRVRKSLGVHAPSVPVRPPAGDLPDRSITCAALPTPGE